MYSSLAVTALDADELETLLGRSRRNNRRDGLSGILVHVVDPDDGFATFVQVLEGEKAPVEACFARIAKDDLHTGLQVLSSGEVPGRDFEGWTMRLEQLAPAEVADGEDIVDVVRDEAAMAQLVGRYAGV
jgi:nucleotide-binding universal stress UspA family protein